MTSDRPPDVLGVRVSLPAPGWTVLDAARNQRFTGELVATTDTGIEYRVYLDRGDVYVAERATDPSLGVRLVEAGAINSAQLDYGTLRIGDVEHLGRLFERVPSIHRDAVFVLNQLMTEETVRGLAGRLVDAVEATPYRHHPSGMHRWSASDPSGTPPPWGDQPEMALPAPAPDARPIAGQPAPAPSADSAASAGSPIDIERRSASRAADDTDAASIDDLFLDDVVEWNEPSLLVESSRSSRSSTAERRELFPSTPALGSTDWADRLGADGLADAPVEPAVHARLPPVAVPPADQFELIWPSGETVDVMSPPLDADADHNAERNDDQFVDQAHVDEGTRLRTAPVATPPSAGRTTHDQPESTTPGDAAADDAAPEVAAAPGPSTSDGTEAETGRAPETENTAAGDADDEPSIEPAAESDPSDDALAVRRAVATIDTGSLAVRRRLASPGNDVPAPPGRLIVGRDHHTAWRSGSERPIGSVFDAQPATFPESTVEVSESDEPQDRRSGALKRLISSLRRGE